MSRGLARGPLGWAGALSPRMGRVGFPSFWFLLEIVGWCSNGEEISTCVQVESRGSCHSPRRVFDPNPSHGGGDPPQPHRGTNPPLTPQAHAQAHLRHLRPLGPLRERGREEQRQTLALLRQRLPLVQYWREEGWIPAVESRNDGGVGGG